MKHRENTWGWMLAVDFFFAGMGGGMLLITGLGGLFFGEGSLSFLGVLLGPIFIAIGAGFLILELGRPFQAWRVFLNPKAILTFGAWNMLLAIGCGLIYTSFTIPAFAWSGWVVGRKILAILCVIFGLIVAAYPGILLGRHKSRPFWTGPAILVLFLLSSLATGSAAQLISGLVLPPSRLALMNGMAALTAGLLGFQLVLWPTYIWIKRTGSTTREAESALKWIKGDLAFGFWFGFLFAETLFPIILMLLPGGFAHAMGAILLLLGGLWMRLKVIETGNQRTWLPGEERYRSRLPAGDEAFLKAWSRKRS